MSRKRDRKLPYVVKFKGQFGDINYECEADTKAGVKQAKQDMKYFFKKLSKKGEYVKKSVMKDKLQYWKVKSKILDKEKKVLMAKLKMAHKIRLEDIIREQVKWEVERYVEDREREKGGVSK